MPADEAAVRKRRIARAHTADEAADETRVRKRGIARARAFRRMDFDHDGLVSLEEMRKYHLEARTNFCEKLLLSAL